MEIMQAAEQLGRAIKESELYRRLRGKSAYENDQTLMGTSANTRPTKNT